MKTQYFRKNSIKALIFGALAILSLSCSKTTESIGDGLLSENDQFEARYIDTLDIICHSETIDSMATKGLNSFLLGSLMDPVMGLTNANIFTQLHLSSTNQNYGDDHVIDSVVLQLSLDGYYGDTTTLQTIHVYALTDSLCSTEKYYQFSDVNADVIDLANGYQFRPHPQTRLIQVGNDTINHPVIRIPLSNTLGEQLAANTAAHVSSESFKQFFYGLKISCESVNQDGAICYITPTSNNITQLQVYYHETPTATNQMRYYYYITSEDSYFNQYLHDYSLGSPEFVDQVVNGNTALGQEKLYLQSTGGIRTVISLPGFKAWADSLIDENSYLIINEAKLIIPSLLSDTGVLTPPTSLALTNVNDNGTTSLLPDYLEGSTYYGGNYSSLSRNVIFRISEYLQEFIRSDRSHPRIYVNIIGAAFNAQRWVVAGPEANQDHKLKCEIKYSIVKI